MEDVRVDAKKRFDEIELFLKILKELEKMPRSTAEKLPSARQSSSLLKACTFLLLYNAIESCVRSTLAQIYMDIETSKVTYSGTSSNIRELWLRQQFNVPTDTANHATYLALAAKVADSVSIEDVMKLESRKLPISGNLDGDSIRILCNKHGLDLRVPKWAKGGVEMATVKDQRNALAHGHKSFAECGRDYAVKDLSRIVRQTQHFLNGFMRSAALFSKNSGYRAIGSTAVR